ncbi:MAG: GNAT family N-acetyltransferase [Sedimentisphaerales bacterium]|jgi:GNAT superfamily N-acetyltransferase
MKEEEIQVEYLPDSSVDAALDAQIRRLLTTCFTKPEDVVFRDRRYFIEPYPHRWVIRNARGVIIAHVGVHEKTVEADGRTFRIGGVAEVCVHPDFRGRGFVKAMLACIHDWLIRHEFDFAVLFGGPAIYGSSGYVEVNNLVHDDLAAAGEKCTSQSPAMVRRLSNPPWPDGQVYLPGPKF